MGRRLFYKAMKRPYEIAFIVRIESAGDEAINDQVTQVQGWIEANGSGQVTKIDRWGRRKLAYEIDRQREGYYVIMEANVDPKALPEVERNLKLSSAILRYLIVRTDE
jgi:small subunit ribosomal protein S6